jgi:hypothetical protein
VASKVTLADALASVQPTHIGVKCYTCSAVSSMTKEDREVFEEALTRRDITNPMMVRALKAAGYEVSKGSLARHRRGECMPLE